MEGCFSDCLYCYLQAYQNPPLVKLFVNLAEIPGRIDALLEKEAGAQLFFAAGILSDSLDLDRVTRLSAVLFPYFNGKDGPVLEMRTKSSAVGHLPPGKGRGGRVLLSWTLSTPEVHRMLERGTASPENRIRAAAAARKKGYPVAFHLDPIFYHPGWEKAYEQLIDRIQALIDAEGLSHMTLGGFRYGEALKRIIGSRASGHRLFLGEFVRCADGKFRYFAPIRIHFYQRISRMIHAAFPDLPVALNMETPQVWRQWRAGSVP
jgi:spore photoproduct lyase